MINHIFNRIRSFTNSAKIVGPKMNPCGTRDFRTDFNTFCEDMKSSGSLKLMFIKQSYKTDMNVHHRYSLQ